jgi:putative transposase
MIGISRSSYYAHSEKKALEREEKDTDLLSKIEEIHLEMPFYGYRRIQAELARRGEKVNHKRLKRVRQKNKIRAVQFRSFTPQTQNIVIEFFQILLRDFSL